MQPSFLRQNIYYYDTYLSTFEEKEKKQARFPRENGVCEWPQGALSQTKKRQKEVDRFWRKIIETQIISTWAEAAGPTGVAKNPVTWVDNLNAVVQVWIWDHIGKVHIQQKRTTSQGKTHQGTLRNGFLFLFVSLQSAAQTQSRQRFSRSSSNDLSLPQEFQERRWSQSHQAQNPGMFQIEQKLTCAQA